MRLTFYGGTGEIGGTKIMLKDKETVLLLDFGMSFRQRKRYYQQFLTPRTCNGVADLLRLGIIPAMDGLYRDDPVGGVSSSAQVEVAGVLLSHAHADHANHISLLRTDIPVMGSEATRYLLEAVETCGQSTFENEVLTTSLRRPGQYRYEKVKREFVSLEPWEPRMIGDVSVTMAPVDHSVPGAAGFIIDTSSGAVVYTGDLRLHGRRREDTRRFLEMIGKREVSVLIIEGTNVTEDEGLGEPDVRDRVSSVLRKAEGRTVFCSCAVRDLDRLATFHELAQEAGRRLVVGHKTAYLLEAMASPELGLPSVDDVCVYTPRKRWGVYDEREYDVWERPYVGRANAVRAGDVRSEPEKYVMYLDFFSLGELVDVDPEGESVMIHSQAEPFCEEMEFDFERLHNWLVRFNVRYEHAHASGHLYGRELEEIVSGTRADTIIPVHTEHPERFLQFSDRVRLVTDGGMWEV